MSQIFATSADDNRTAAPDDDEVFVKVGEHWTFAVDEIDSAFFWQNAAAEVICCNAAAMEILDRADGLILKGRSLCFTDSSINGPESRIASLIASVASSSEVFEIVRADGSSSYTAQLIWMRRRKNLAEAMDQFLMLVSDPTRDLENSIHELATVYGLTPAEVRVVERLVVGHTAREVSETLGLQEVTVRNHIARAINKTGVQGQLGLLQLFLRARIPRR